MVLGVDGGASKTLCLVGSGDGRILGWGRAGPSNHQGCGLSQAVSAIVEAVRQARASAGVGSERVELGVFCLAGADLPEDYAMLTQALEREKLVQRVVVRNDTLGALRSGLSRPWGVVVVCGTGFNAAGVAPDGREIVLPGLGYMSGDWGGGSQISQEIVRRAMRGWDGRDRETALLPLVLTRFSCASPEDLMRALYKGTIDSRKLLDLVPLLFEAAFQGDEVACALVREIGTEVGVTARTLIRRLSLERTDVELVLAGSVFKAVGPLLVDVVRAVVHEAAPRAQIVLPRFEPVVGAFLLAVEARGGSASPAVMTNLAGTLPQEFVIERS